MNSKRDQSREAPSVPVDLLLGLLLLALGGFTISISGTGLLDWALPVGIAVGIVICGGALVARGLATSGTRMSLVPPVLRGGDKGVVVFIIVGMLYLIGMRLIGFWLSSIAVIGFLGWHLSTDRSWRTLITSTLIAVALAVVVYVVMSYVFYVPLPRSRVLPL